LDPSNPSARRIYLSVLGNDAACADDDDDTDLAIEICNRQLSIDPGYIPAAAHLASLHFEVGEEDEGRAVIGRIIAIDPNDFNKRLYAGRIYLENGYEKEAEQEFQQAAEINPDNECLIRIGDAYLDESEFKKAARYFKKAAATASISELLDISKLLFGSKRISEAERYVDMALKKDPEHPEPHLGKAIMLLSRRKEEEGLRELDEAERLARGRREFQNTIEEAQEIKREIRQISEISRMMGDLMNMSPGDFKSMPADIRRMLDEMMEDL
jgi:tetratricopeptide (TPR) repeat protein